jgi:hypothetical protein
VKGRCGAPAPQRDRGNNRYVRQEARQARVIMVCIVSPLS